MVTNKTWFVIKHLNLNDHSVVQENMHILSPHRRDWKFQRGGGGGERGVLEKILSMGDVWIFSGTEH